MIRPFLYVLHVKQLLIAHIVTLRTSPVNLGFQRRKIRVLPSTVGERKVRRQDVLQRRSSPLIVLFPTSLGSFQNSRVRISVGVGFAGTSSRSRALCKELLK
ncbi:hypothetical protein FOQG_02494 [Fusarium oxysporum f. sp. raphani 54005]|uniref:Uncharacterized protein n=8 Tax=Fusarium oxysporum species complex TaxID=171631 RepID=W9JB74_FUSOX|nr:uncharacterized protein FOIG_03482 [Fusarium odoratissimum NRRL 54006]EWZ02117.1 hypothetical protein FOYG_01518 [Fusarium oxysporum NRRL 32931]EXA42241.1 hypothetical protein FOVG_07536 [Fusarium oxysporum f. sp. pisi HDV247]EXK45509.1 hypothetical protein FOMG_03927 [Fusarium oxysporum f. sp. melonis 26406]EXK97225.1 hypothetical protein FOQG_02494 [Fusarium oxysporum f. sp. raphani 54005]EXL80202.1 hypothetical protein FOPG_06143 [Fusarium oxysporum f. sp. conglutinans race 2 54008]EXM3